MFKEKAPWVFTAISENLRNLNGPISLDIDAVTQATFNLALTNASHELGKYISKDQLVTYWELSNIFEKNSIPDAHERAKASWNNHDVYLRSPVMPGITTLLEIFNGVNLPYVFVSSRPPEFLETTHRWFAQRLPWVKPEDIILGRPEKVSGGYFKAAVITKHKILLHIEDALEEAMEIVDKTPASVLVVPQPWNINQQINHPRIKQLDPSIYGPDAGVWPLVRFLASNDAKVFLQNVAQY